MKKCIVLLLITLLPGCCRVMEADEIEKVADFMYEKITAFFQEHGHLPSIARHREFLREAGCQNLEDDGSRVDEFKEYIRHHDSFECDIGFWKNSIAVSMSMGGNKSDYKKNKNIHEIAMDYGISFYQNKWLSAANPASCEFSYDKDRFDGEIRVTRPCSKGNCQIFGQ